MILIEQFVGSLLKDLVNVLKTLKAVLVEILFGMVLIVDTYVWFLSELF